ncbi:hypothetical protein [Streptomyces himalayensis]|uniref:Transmembrane protein n=1 Tax=Streptomyces himalayensis subsp. himalayensis TaxID=2756131 RepID=A0A7W0IDU4_9ACTN|nr:hypothetical protein [Streptomyces himalayensis]MBA2951604.1 hypothetical protein [Streptomyces himalayensis subsp. himalayensis]
MSTETNPTDADRETIRRLMAAIDEIPAPTSFRDDSPIPIVGSAPPVAQPGRPPMSQKATDASALMLSGSVLTAVVGGSATAILWASGGADPIVVAMVFGAPAALVLALSRLVKRAKGVLPDEHHHHYDGPVYQDQRSTSSTTRGVWAKTNNQ